MTTALTFTPQLVFVGSIPLDFILFALTLLGIALFHKYTLQVALTGLAVTLAYKIGTTGFKTGAGLAGFAVHLSHEWVMLANLFALLMGFTLLSKHFEDSRVPDVLPKILPDDWKGGFVLLVMVFILSSFLDNIAAALIGGSMAHAVFRGKVHIGYLAAIVAASNAGGSGSVVGDTTTTMMWIAGVAPADVFHAYVAAAVALVVCGIPAALQQQKYSPIYKVGKRHVQVDYVRVAVVVFILATAVVVNIVSNLKFAHLTDHIPFLGLAVWIAILLCVPVRRPDWSLMPGAFRGTIFLLSLVLTASMMPVDQLPTASLLSALGLGFVSAVFDNIPLTELALKQGGYDWGFLAYAVGFGGSMLWFGSSAGVALSNNFPEAKSAWLWIKHGWHVAVAYVVGFAVMAAVLGWQPTSQLKSKATPTTPTSIVATPRK
ncbi:MAG: citrate transporter [Rhodocyclaceae bacterium]|nr:citrate transporter [Rhodocyclaceae bacterium]MCA3019128.1 citrate transporter [Rhodocyclaceae bacterium]MCA3022770.1 citrate transporter [Rhodocyclaceae bacterium]MCA3025043.1 citrate transporter [Rhodocyclaceae bacterium]MCA3032405.1 citrate transporter [Rhodocyclaceae bacterium]